MIPPYPSTPVRAGSTDVVLVKKIQRALQRAGIGGLTPGLFDVQMTSAIKLFQSQNVDLSGSPLKADGIVGRFTWIALFGFAPTTSVPLALLPAQAMSVAIQSVGVREAPDLANRGVEVDKYLMSAGISNPAGNKPNGYPWCQAFVYWCFDTACSVLGRANPSPQTAGVLDHWNRARTVSGVVRRYKAEALADIRLVAPGQLLVLDYGQGLGHIGFVERVFDDGRLVTIEGNTNNTASREGLGVFRLERRKLSDENLKGFLDYSAA